MRDVRELERLTGQGDVDAATEYGRRMLNGEWGREHQKRGAEMLDAAAADGNGEAAALVAMMAGAGVYRPQNWDQALDLLQHAAELGWKPAQAQLALLSADRERHGEGPEHWQALRRGIDLAAWLAVPPKLSLSEAPRIRRVEQFIPASVCNWMIMRGRSKLRRAQVYGEDASARFDAGRTNSEADFSIVEVDLVLLLLRARIAAVTGLPTAVMELTKVLHYEPGQRFDNHYDFIDPEAPGYAQELMARGQRIATFLVYLNDDFEGGETDFPALGLRHRGKRGDALLFANCDARNEPDRRTLHAGLPPTRGEKWLLSQWIRNRTPSSA